MLGKQLSDERMYLRREAGRIGLKSMRDVYKETKVRVACYIAKSNSKWIQAALLREKDRGYISLECEAREMMQEPGYRIEFKKGGRSAFRRLNNSRTMEVGMEKGQDDNKVWGRNVQERRLPLKGTASKATSGMQLVVKAEH